MRYFHFSRIYYASLPTIGIHPICSRVIARSRVLKKQEPQERVDPEMPSISLDQFETSESNTTLIMQGLRVTAEYLSHQSSEQNAQLISILLKSQDEIALLREKLVGAQEKQSELLSQVQMLTQQMVNSASEKDIQEQERYRIREQKRVRKRRPLKDPLDISDLRNILSLIKDKFKDQTISSRYQLSVCLLYVFGIRVNELRQIKIGHLKEFMNGQPLLLQIGKTKIRSKFPFPSSKGTRKFLTEHVGAALDFVFQNIPSNQSLVPISREHLTRELNSLISEYGKTVNKTLLSHSCRVSFITRVCKTAGIEAARAMVGHAHLSTTQIYNRNYLSTRSQLKIFNDSLNESNFRGEDDPALDHILNEDSL